MEDEHDRLLRLAAFDRARELSRRYTDLVPLDILKEGFAFDGRRISFGSFYSGIFRPKELHGPSGLMPMLWSSFMCAKYLQMRTNWRATRDRA